MKYIKQLLVLSLLASCQTAFASDEIAMHAYDMQKLEANGPVKEADFNLAETINDKQVEVPLVTQYLGYQASVDKITNNTNTLAGGSAASVKITRRRDLDCHGLSCFDTISATGTPGRIWIDLGSERKVNFPRCFKYKTWGITALTQAEIAQINSTK